MDDRMLGILKERARRYSLKIESPSSTVTSLGTFVGYRSGDLIFGIPSQIVHEFAALQNWTPFTGRRFLVGLTHLRGDVMSLVDLSQAVTGKPATISSWMLVIQGKGGRVAAPATEIIGIRSVEMSELLAPEQSPVESPLLMATTVDLWFLLDEQKLNSVFEGLSVFSDQ